MLENYQFHYTLKGKKNKKCIVFLHGFLGSGDDWNEIVTNFTGNFQCLLIDLPGHGNTIVHGDSRNYSIENCSAALIELFDYLNIETCSIVGYSMGGRLALFLLLLCRILVLRTCP